MNIYAPEIHIVHLYPCHLDRKPIYFIFIKENIEINNNAF